MQPLEANNEPFATILVVGGKTNSLGRAAEVVQAVLDNQTRLEELYNCLSDDDPWVRMRAADSLEKICRLHPDWLVPYVDRLIQDYSDSQQPSILWHLAQIFETVPLSDPQLKQAIGWLKNVLSSSQIDWIVAANAMDTLAKFERDGLVAPATLERLLKIQQQHKSNAIKKRATKLLTVLSA